MVARMCHLAQESHLLYRGSTRDLHSRLVPTVHISCVPKRLSDSPTVTGILGFHRPGVVRTTGLALLEVYNPYLAVFAILSLATNVSATSLIAYKAWCVPVVLCARSGLNCTLAYYPTGNTDDS